MIKIITNMAGVQRALSKIQNDGVAKQKTLTNISERGKQDLQSRAKKSKTTATGNLINSIKTKVSSNKASIFSSLNYSNIALETGRRPGKMPPISALQRWAGLKLGNKKLAFLVARSIGRKGTKANKFVTQTVQELNRRIIPKYLKDYWNQISR